MYHTVAMQHGEAAPNGEKAALLVVDMQRDFFSRNPAVSSSFPGLPDEIARLIVACRAAGHLEVQSFSPQKMCRQ